MRVQLDEGAFLPTRAYETDAGLDLYAKEDLTVWPGGGSGTFDTGVHIELPHGMYGKIESKSGLNVNHSIVCLGGVIDEGYTGSVVVKLYNFGIEPHTFKRGDKIAQLIVQPCSHEAVELVAEIDKNTARGDNGFGSTDAGGTST